MSRRKIYQDTGNQDYKTYSEVYDNLRLRSDILKNRSGMHINLNDERGLLSELNQLIGTKDGKWLYAEANTWKIAAIPAVLQELIELEKQFQRYRQQRINNGFAMIPDSPESYPPELKKKLQTLQAKEDVFNEEVSFLTKALEVYANSKKVEQDRSVLKYGCKQVAKGGGELGSIRIIDGQNVSLIGGIPVINDSQSPYDGMAVMDYRSVICKLFQVQRNQIKVIRLAKAQQVAKEAGEPIPTDVSLGIVAVSRASLPAWPSGVTNHKKK